MNEVALGKIDQYNKAVIAALSGKRKSVSRPTRSVKYKSIAKLPFSKCEVSFISNAQLVKHKRTMHTKGPNDSTGSFRNIPIVDDLSLLYILGNESLTAITKEISLKEACPVETNQSINMQEVIVHQ